MRTGNERSTMKTYTHYFKQAIEKDGKTYQQVIGLNEEYDWRLILDLAESPSWQLITFRQPPVCRFPEKRHRRFRKKNALRCPHCRTRLTDCEARYPDGRVDLFLLPPKMRRVELWHDDETRCPHCGCRIGVNLKEKRAALPAPKENPLAHLPILRYFLLSA